MSGTRTRTTIPFGAHAAIETVAAPAVMAAPFIFGFGQAASVIAFAFGAMLLGLAFQAVGPRRSVPVSAHAGFDYTLAAFAILGGFAVGLGTGEWNAATFLVGVGAVLVALTASTRFSVPAGA
jgi:hypothetical protein